MKRNLLNCWNTLKTIRLQRGDEIYASANAAKAEKIYGMAQGVNLNVFNGQSAAKLRIGERSETIPIEGVGLQAIGGSKWQASSEGEDIVQALLK